MIDDAHINMAAPSDLKISNLQRKKFRTSCHLRTSLLKFYVKPNSGLRHSFTLKIAEENQLPPITRQASQITHFYAL